MIRIVIMASGFSRRMGSDKLLLPLRGKALIAWVLEAACSVGAENVTVIYRDEAVAALARAYGAQTLFNPGAAQGQSSAVRLASEHLGQSADLLFLAGDQPLVKPETLRSLIGRFQESRPDIITAAWQGKGCLPVLFASTMSRHLQTLSGDKGGRMLIDSGRFTVLWHELQQEAEKWDIDTAEDLLHVTQWLETGAEKSDDRTEPKTAT